MGSTPIASILFALALALGAEALAKAASLLATAEQAPLLLILYQRFSRKLFFT
jgi:hypothetical protein